MLYLYNVHSVLLSVGENFIGCADRVFSQLAPHSKRQILQLGEFFLTVLSLSFFTQNTRGNDLRVVP